MQALDGYKERQAAMANICTECGCSCSKMLSDGDTLQPAMDTLSRLKEQLQKSESWVAKLETELSELRLAGEKNITTAMEQQKRLKDSYDETVKRNQELEEQVLKMADEMQEERERFEEALKVVTERLVETREKMNKMETETVKNRKDCSLVVQLLKCNDSRNKNYLSEQVDSFPQELKSKLQDELNLETSNTSKQRSKSHPPPSQNNTRTAAKSRRLFARRSKSASSDNTSGDPPKRAVLAVYTGAGFDNTNPTKI
ncbi:predicted protein [Nematostella vectensis]|uniref:Uncharacterized protein n=1 Tax=Nematostella vectensis TaxID=45351 RepID=A7RJ20_NEMVE|nr:predicted protein [Nematostella vectensis]|eukprot:XP_001640563.1 predicted protein [Nematostella vectensis]